MSQICRNSKSVSEGNLRSKFVKIAACILAVAFLMVSGCSNGDKKENKASNSASSTAQQSSKTANSPESALSKFGIKGKVINSTYGNHKDGFMANVDNKIYIVDLKNDQVASVENYSFIANEINKYRGGASEHNVLIPQFLIYNDKQHGKDDQLGEWRGKDHFLPVYIIIQGDAAGNIKANGNMSSGKGAAPSHYQGYLEEQKDIDLGNLFLKEIVPFMGPLANVVAAPPASKPAGQQGSASAAKTGTKMELSAAEQQKLSVFFSNFAEAWGNSDFYNFAYDAAKPMQLTLFGIKHNAINRKFVLVDRYKVPLAEVKAAVRKYMGRDFDPYTKEKYFSYGGNCVWIDPKAAGFSMGDATLQSMYNNGDGTYTAYVTVNAIEDREADIPPVKKTWQAILTVSPYDSSRYVLRAWKRL